MRLIPVAGAVFVLGLFLYAFASFAMVSAVIQPTTPFGGLSTGPRAQEQALPLEKAAPEIVRLRTAFRDLAATAREVVSLCPNRDPESEPARPRGKVLVWDVEKQDISDAHGRLPAELRLQSADDPCTAYLIVGRERRAVMNYNYDIFHGGGSTGVQGFRTDLFVCAVDLPSMQPRGRYRINGNGPPQLVELKPSVREIDEDWAGNLQRWIETCTKGPEPCYYAPYQQATPRAADQARLALDQCEVLGSLPTLVNLPSEAVIWNPQTDRTHPAHGYLQNKADGANRSPLVVIVLDDLFVRERNTGRFDYRVALVSFPGANPLGIYQVRGESWPLPAKPGDNWAPADPNARNPTRALSQWVSALSRSKRGLPPGTLAVGPDAVHLAGSDWLRGPGWFKRRKTDLPAEKQGWTEMAEECSTGVAACRAKGSPAAVGKLPRKIVVWVDDPAAECFFPSPAQQKLPKALQASPKDREVLMALVVGSDYVQEPKNAPKTERFDHELALFTMPGARPIGVYKVRGETLDFKRDRNATNARSADSSKEIADWLKRFVESPKSVAQQPPSH